jgi:hypothetical protein
MYALHPEIRNNLLNTIIKITVSTSIIVILAALIIIYYRISLESVRGSLGQWNISILDSHGMGIGTGQVNFIPDNWKMDYSLKSPFFVFTPCAQRVSGRF